MTRAALKPGTVLYRAPGFTVRKHMAEAKSSPLWKLVRVHIAVRHLARLDALRNELNDRAYVLDDALAFAFGALDKIEARRAKRAAARRKPSAPEPCDPAGCGGSPAY